MRPNGLQPTRFLCPWILQPRIGGPGFSMPSSMESSQPRD